jgi:hypothetical protein
MTDNEILDLLIECGGSTWAVAETQVDADVARGEYEGCSSELEMAFTEYEARAKAILAEAGGI